MGARLASAPRHGHASISDDGAGNIVLADGAQLLVAAGTNVAPSIALKTNTDLGIDLQNTFIRHYINVLSKLIVDSTGVATTGLHVGGEAVYTPSADQLITGVASTIAPNAAQVKINSNGVYALTTAIVAGSDGQLLRIENVSVNEVTLQEGVVIPGNSIVDIVYSADLAAWAAPQ